MGRMLPSDPQPPCPYETEHRTHPHHLAPDLAAVHHVALSIRHRHYRRVGGRAHRLGSAGLHRPDHPVSYDVHGSGDGRRERRGGLHQPVPRGVQIRPGEKVCGARDHRLYRHRIGHCGGGLGVAGTAPAPHPDAREHHARGDHVPDGDDLGHPRAIHPHHRRGRVPFRQDGAHPAVRNRYGLPAQRIRRSGLRARLVGFPHLRCNGDRLLHARLGHRRGRAHAVPADAARAVHTRQLPRLALDQGRGPVSAQGCRARVRHVFPVADRLYGPVRHHGLPALRQGQRPCGADHGAAGGVHFVSARRGVQHDRFGARGPRARRGQPPRGQTNAARHARHRLRRDVLRRSRHMALAHGARGPDRP